MTNTISVYCVISLNLFIHFLFCLLAAIHHVPLCAGRRGNILIMKLTFFLSSYHFASWRCGPLPCFILQYIRCRPLVVPICLSCISLHSTADTSPPEHFCRPPSYTCIFVSAAVASINGRRNSCPPLRLFCISLISSADTTPVNLHRPPSFICIWGGHSRGLQRDVVYLGWPIAPSYMSPNKLWITPYLTYDIQSVKVECFCKLYHASEITSTLYLVNSGIVL